MTTRDRIVATADQAVQHELVRGVIEEFADNMNFVNSGLPAYGMEKVAHYAAQVAVALFQGIDPNSLRLTAEEFAALWGIVREDGDV